MLVLLSIHTLIGMYIRNVLLSCILSIYVARCNIMTWMNEVYIFGKLSLNRHIFEIIATEVLKRNQHDALSDVKENFNWACISGKY